jgi:hypothetical protein
VAAQGSSRARPGRQGRVVSDRPSLLQDFFPARSYCADARASVRAKVGHSREKVRGRLPARLVMSRLAATRCGGAGGRRMRWLRPGEGRALAGGGTGPGWGRDGPWPGEGRALARGQARARQGGRGLPLTKRHLPRGRYSAIGRILRCGMARSRCAGPTVTGVPEIPRRPGGPVGSTGWTSITESNPTQGGLFRLRGVITEL